MTIETARLLAQAVKHRDIASEGLTRLLSTHDAFTDPPPALGASLRELAETYVHEQRIINRIVSEAQDE